VLILKGEGTYALTETVKGTYEFDRETLETKQQVLEGGLLRTAHAAEFRERFYFVETSFSPPGYAITTTDRSLRSKERVAFVPSAGSGGAPSWIHSLAVTETGKLVFVETPAVYDLRKLVFGSENGTTFRWTPDAKSTWLHVVDLDTKDTTRVQCPSNFFLFHFANAFEEGGLGELHVDVCAFEDADIIDALLLKAMRSEKGGDIPASTLTRLTLKDGEITTTRMDDDQDDDDDDDASGSSSRGSFSEFAAINENFRGKAYRFAYANGARRPTPVANVVTKTDLHSRTTRPLLSDLEYEAVGEPLFVPRHPRSSSEDDGAVLAVGHHGPSGEAHLLIFDARTCREEARLVVPSPGIPYGFHGLWDDQTTGKE